MFMLEQKRLLMNHLSNLLCIYRNRTYIVMMTSWMIEETTIEIVIPRLDKKSYYEYPFHLIISKLLSY